MSSQDYAPLSSIRRDPNAMTRNVASVTLGISLFALSARAVDMEVAFPFLTFTQPVDLQHAGDGSNRLFVVERAGRIWVFDNHPSTSTAKLFLDITSRVNSGGSEEGLLGLAFHPEYPDSGIFYVDYTALGPRRTVIARYEVTENADSADATSEVVLLEIGQPFANHNGGQIRFGSDRYLYISVGDGGSGGDPAGNGQNPATLLGSLLRIDVDSRQDGLPYAIPPSNPFLNNNMGYRKEIYAYGLRNPWRFSFDPTTKKLWLADVGQGSWEEIDIIENGGNYGWNRLEGNHCYDPPVGCDSSGTELPVWEYPHFPDRSITGGFVYRGPAVQSLWGKYIYADFGSGRIWALEYDGINPATDTLLFDTTLSPSTFGVDEFHELYLCNYFAGDIYRFRPTVTGVEDRTPAVPGTLAQNYPNPFNPETTIDYTIFVDGDVRLDVYDVEGSRVRTLVASRLRAGPYSARWDGKDARGEPQATGVYFYRLSMGSRVIETRQMVLLR